MISVCNMAEVGRLEGYHRDKCIQKGGGKRQNEKHQRTYKHTQKLILEIQHENNRSLRIGKLRRHKKLLKNNKGGFFSVLKSDMRKRLTDIPDILH